MLWTRYFQTTHYETQTATVHVRIRKLSRARASESSVSIAYTMAQFIRQHAKRNNDVLFAVLQRAMQS